MPPLMSVAGPLLRFGLTAWARRRRSRHSGTQTVAGPSAAIEIVRDRWGVPHIYAASERDAHFAQGYVHAQDRLFQMDLRRRVAQGTLSEAFGANALPTDRFARTLGIHRAARADWAGGSADVRDVFEAYAEGVNACMSGKRWRPPVECALLGYRMKPWSPEDSMSFARLMTWQLAFGWHGELVWSRLREAVGADAAAEWGFTYPEGNPITLPGGVISRDLRQGTGLPLAGGASGPGGSNAWAVAGQRSATGAPLLCNDPHLFVSSPAVWYELHLSAPGFEVAGASMPGIPTVLIGHNERIAWGITAAFTDCQDLFAERFEGGGSPRYQWKGASLEADVLDEPITVKGIDEPERFRVTVTRHGPVVAEGAGDSNLRFALSAVALTGPGDAGGWIALNRASDWKGFTEALRKVQSAQLNVVYADVDGNIGYRLTGRIPVRAAGDGALPAPGWSGDHEWTGFLPFESMPHALNPADGLIVTANNKIVDKPYPHFLGNAWMNGYRAAGILRVLGREPKVTLEMCQELHTDVTCIPALDLARRVLALDSDDPDMRTAQELFRGWDGRLAPDSAAAALYSVARHRLVATVLAAMEDKEIATGLTGVGPQSILAPGNELYGNDLDAVFRMLDRPGSWWIQRAGGPGAALTTSVKQAVEWLRSELGPATGRWRWGRIHRVRFPHPVGLRPPMDKVFDRGPYPIGGDMDTPAQTGIAPNRPFDARAACPSYRQIVDLSDFGRSLAMHAPGQSGQIGSRHYDDLIKPWRRGEYHPMLWTRGQVDAHAKRRMHLVPETGY